MLIVRVGALGDILLLRRAVAALRGAGCTVGLLAPLPAAEALQGDGQADVQEHRCWDRPEVAALAAGEGPARGVFADWLASFTTTILISRNEMLVEAMKRLATRVFVQDPVPRGREHASRWFARPALAAGGHPNGEPPAHEPSSEEAAAADRLNGRLPPAFLAVHPGSGSPSKSWPAERYAHLVEALSPDRPWLLVKGPADDRPAARLRDIGQCVTVEGLRPRTLGALLARAGLYVGNDSGVSHLAAAWGAPTLALFGPTDPAVWSPLGPRVQVLREGTRTMEGLRVETVEASARAALSSWGLGARAR